MIFIIRFIFGVTMALMQKQTSYEQARYFLVVRLSRSICYLSVTHLFVEASSWHVGVLLFWRRLEPLPESIQMYSVHQNTNCSAEKKKTDQECLILVESIFQLQFLALNRSCFLLHRTSLFVLLCVCALCVLTEAFSVQFSLRSS